MFCFPAKEAIAREPIRLELESTIPSRYIWRGEMSTDDPVFWQTVTFRYKGFRAWNFFNVDLTDINNDRFELNEYDYIFDYTISFKNFSVAPGMLHFTSPTSFFPSSTKITFDVKTTLPLHPRLRVRIDPKKSKGSYYILSLSKKTPLIRNVSDIEFYSTMGASEPKYYRARLCDDLAVTDLLLGVSVPINVGNGFVLAPYVEFTSLLNRSVREAQRDTGAKIDTVTWALVLNRGLEF